MQLTLIYLSRHLCHRCHNFHYSGQHIEIFWKKSLVYLYIPVEIGYPYTSGFGSAGPGCRSRFGSGKMMPIRRIRFRILIRIHNTASLFYWVKMWMRYSRVARASDNQCRSRNCPGFYPSILRHSGI
jgi:hypothetical protein